MPNQETRVVIAAPTFGSPFHISMIDNLRKLFKPEQMTQRSVTDDIAIQKGRLKQVLEQTKPTALIAISIRPDSDTIAAYNAGNVPIILIDEETTGVSTITTDNCEGGRIAGEYLMKIGKKKIAIVTGRTKVKGGYNAEQRLKGVDAIFCAAGDNCALGLLSGARDRGVRVPEDVAIVGFDDLLIAQLSTPALTTIRQPLKEMAEAAYNMVVNQRDQILNKPQNAVFHPELVIRKSA
jgi:LacI family transcriptional regulator